VKDIVGFGDSSSEHATTTSNAYVRVTTRPTFEGAEVTVECKDGMHLFGTDERKKTLILVREKKEPHPGQRVMLDGRLVKVSKTRRSHEGRLEVFDEDTQTWLRWSK